MTNIDIVPECNLGIEKCKNGTKERNAIFLVAETDYVLAYQTIELPMPKQLFKFIMDSQCAGIVR